VYEYVVVVKESLWLKDVASSGANLDVLDHRSGAHDACLLAGWTAGKTVAAARTVVAAAL